MPGKQVGLAIVIRYLSFFRSIKSDFGKTPSPEKCCSSAVPGVTLPACSGAASTARSLWSTRDTSPAGPPLGLRSPTYGPAATPPLRGLAPRQEPLSGIAEPRAQQLTAPSRPAGGGLGGGAGRGHWEERQAHQGEGEGRLPWHWGVVGSYPPLTWPCPSPTTTSAICSPNMGSRL